MADPRDAARDATHDRIDLPGGGALVLRPGVPDDLDGLMALYESLTSDDRYRRFFSSAVPSRSLIGRWLEPDPVACTLVVVAEEPGEEPRIVAEAGYRGPAGSDPEFAATVARRWRGWVGPWLVDRLLSVAAERGVPCLVADVLVDNKPMRAVLEQRGYAAIDHPDWPTVRVVVGTAGRTPPWPGGHERPRVLVEAPGGRWYAEEAARTAGLQVVVCPGPKGRRGAPCPLLTDDPCPLADGADAIVVALHPDDDTDRIVAAHVRRAAVPICVQTRGGRGPAIPEDAGGDVTALPSGIEEDQVVAWAREAVGLPPAG